MLPREKALNIGINSLSNEELLALIIKSGYKDADVFALSKMIIDKANGFDNLLCLNYEELVSIKGIKKAKALEILAILEIAKRLSNISFVSEKELTSPSKVIEYLRFKLAFSNQEEFLVMFLNRAGRIIKSEVIFRGSKDTSVVGIDEIIRQAILLKSSGLIVCHNHPSGNTSPSLADTKLTNDLAKACSMMNLRLMDHIIISKSSYYSFKQANML